MYVELKKKKKKGKISGKCLIAVTRFSEGLTMLVIIVYNRVVKIATRSLTLVTGVNIICSQRSCVTIPHSQVTPGLNIMCLQILSQSDGPLAWRYLSRSSHWNQEQGVMRGGEVLKWKAEGDNLPVLFGYWLVLISNSSPPPHFILVLLLFPPNI